MSPLFLPQWGNLQCQSLHPTQAATGGAVRDMWFFWEFNPGFSVLSLKEKNEQKKNIYIYIFSAPCCPDSAFQPHCSFIVPFLYYTVYSSSLFYILF